MQNMNQTNSPDLQDIGPLIEQARQVAVHYRALTGKPIGIFMPKISVRAI
jgi:hypothetical protein